MTAQTPTVLKTYFQTGDLPTQAQYANLIDSYVNTVTPTAQIITSDISALGTMDVTGNLTVKTSALTTLTGNAVVTGTLTVGGVKPIITVKKQIFTSTGTYTPSTGMLFCVAEGVGGGGGSGGCALTSSSQVAAANGGGGGGYFRVVLTAAQIGASQTITIGAAGTAGSTGNNPGGAGGTTSIGTLGVAAGGGAGAGGTTVNGNLVQLPSGAVAAGGTGTTGDVLIQGQSGGQAVGLNFTTVGYSQMAFGGSGGSSIFGAGQPATATFGGGSSPGVAGQLYGGGASGPCSTISIGTQAGAAGSKGIIIITEFCSQ